MHASRLLATVVLALIVAACGEEIPSPSPSATPSPVATPTLTPTATPSPTPEVEAWQRISVEQDGFSLEIPGGWQELSADVLDNPEMLDDLAEANPDAGEALAQGRAALENGDIALFAYDPNVGETGFAANLNVINVGPVAETIEEAAQGVAESIEQQIPVTGEIGVETTTLSGGDAAVVRYEWEIARSGGEPIPVSVVQYAILTGSGTGFILSMSAATHDIGQYHDAFGQIADSFREADS